LGVSQQGEFKNAIKKKSRKAEIFPQLPKKVLTYLRLASFLFFNGPPWAAAAAATAGS
jgi:hypothetical protein